MTRRVEHHSYEERLKCLELFSPKKRRPRRHVFVAFQYLKGAYKKDGERVLTRACSDAIRVNRFKLRVNLHWT